jgi:hypothetical protein
MARDERRDRKAALIGVCFQQQAHWLRALVFDNGTWRAYSSRLLKNLDFDSARRHSESPSLLIPLCPFCGGCDQTWRQSFASCHA